MLTYNEEKDLFYGDDDDQDVVDIDDLFTDEDEVEVDPDTLNQPTKTKRPNKIWTL